MIVLYQVLLWLGISCVRGAIFGCPSGQIRSDIACYNFVTDEVTWPEAQNNCLRSGSEPVKIINLREKHAIQNHLVTTYPEIDSWWVGLEREDYLGGDWKWFGGESVISSVTPWINTTGSADHDVGSVYIILGKMFLSTAPRMSRKAYICATFAIPPQTDKTIDATIQEESTTPIIDKGLTSMVVRGTSEPITKEGYSTVSGHWTDANSGHSNRPKDSRNGKTNQHCKYSVS